MIKISSLKSLLCTFAFGWLLCVYNTAATMSYPAQNGATGAPSQWRAETAILSGKEDINAMFFSDPLHGWVGGKGALYTTEDGGKTWIRNGIIIPEGAVASSIFFVNRDLGWLILQKHDYEGYGDKNDQFWVMHTNNGGRTWRLQIEQTFAIVENVRFNNENEGWLSGARFPSRPVVFHTTDRGEHWSEVSANIQKLIGPLHNGWITDFVPQGNQKALALTLVGAVFETVDGGLHWREVSRLSERRYGVLCICHLGVLEDKSIWIAAGANNDHGTWGVVSIRQPDNTWKEHDLGAGIYLADAQFVSTQRGVASGLIHIGIPDHPKTAGVVMYSPDGGQSWSVIYQNNDVVILGKVFALDSKHVWAGGPNGLIVRLEPISS